MAGPLQSPRGQFYTRTLFHEMRRELPKDDRPHEALFTLYNDVEGLIPFGKVYVELEDPTGYKITQQLLYGEYRHWQELLKCSWFREAKEGWDAELDAKLSSRGFEKLKELAESDAPQAAQAAKFLANKDYREKKTRGRPSKLEVQAALKQETAEEREIQQDIDRIAQGSNIRLVK